jgi:hypothetical protein
MNESLVEMARATANLLHLRMRLELAATPVPCRRPRPSRHRFARSDSAANLGLRALASPEHNETRWAGVNADHILRGQLADALDDEERPGGELLRDPTRHVTIHYGEVVPARWTIWHAHEGLGPVESALIFANTPERAEEESLFHDSHTPPRHEIQFAPDGQPLMSAVTDDDVRHDAPMPIHTARNYILSFNRHNPAEHVRGFHDYLNAFADAPLEEPDE